MRRVESTILVGGGRTEVVLVVETPGPEDLWEECSAVVGVRDLDPHTTRWVTRRELTRRFAADSAGRKAARDYAARLEATVERLGPEAWLLPGRPPDRRL